MDESHKIHVRFPFTQMLLVGQRTFIELEKHNKYSKQYV